jgi:microcystin-dependent protein
MGGYSADRVLATQADNLGQGSGAENHTLATTEIPSHSHRQNDSLGNGQNMYQAGQTSGSRLVSAISDVNATPNTGGLTGGGGAHNNMPPYITLNFIIAFE